MSNWICCHSLKYSRKITDLVLYYLSLHILSELNSGKPATVISMCGSEVLYIFKRIIFTPNLYIKHQFIFTLMIREMLYNVI